MKNKTVKYGYGAVGLSDGAATSFIGSYLMFFITTVAGVNPASAGVITGLATVVSSLWNPIVGFVSDRTVSRFGRRRKYILIAIIPMTLSIILAFSNLGINSMAVKVIYYGFVVTVFWIAFSTFYGPWLALGAEITVEYDERTELRSFAMTTNLIGSIFGLITPPILVDVLVNHEIREDKAWTFMACIVALIVFAGILMTFISTKKCDKTSVKRAGGSLLDIFKDYGQIIKLKPILFIIGMCFCQITSQTIFLSDRIYFFTYNLGLSAVQISIATVAFSIASGIFVYPILALSKGSDKRSALAICMLLSSSACLIIGKVIHISGFGGAIIFTIAFSMSNVAFWQLVPVMLYDVCEYDELINGVKREGIIVSIQSLMETVCNGMGTMILGIVLQLSGFDGNSDIQTEKALIGLENALILIPVILMAICGLLAYKFPITKKVFEEIKQKSIEL